MNVKSIFGLAAALVCGALATGLAQAQTIKIGAPLALTGGLADEGKKQAIAYDMWLKRINAQGGINVGGKKMRVELVQYDYQTQEQRAQQLAEKLIVDDKVDFLLAPFGSGHTKVVAGVAERYGVPVMATSASSDVIFNQGYKFLFGTLAPNSGSVENLIAVVTKGIPSAKRIAILGREDVFPKAMATVMSDAAKKAGLEIISLEYYPVGALDLATPIAKIRSLKPDWIYITGYSKDLVLAKKQMADLNVKAPVVTMITGPVYREFIDSLGPLAEGVTSASWWHHSAQFKGDDPWGSTKAFYDEFVAREKSDPDYVHAAAAAALVALQKAIEKAGTIDKAKVRDALASLDIMTFYGPIKFSANGMNGGRDLPIIQVQGGKPVVLHPESIKQGTLKPVQ
ncbi:MAG TPA: amino acid ABC transporter substrate-binding protein [Burkholderiales bacterium]|nr:amino acid ABC transporter substrate-binding protein [Burkholderiales bacterium]